VRHVLAEERPTRLDPGIVLAVAAVAEAAGGTDPVKELLIDLEGRKVEHPPVAAALRERCIDALGCEAVVAKMTWSRGGDTFPSINRIALAPVIA
jgi:hypothetical protein